MEYSKTHKYRDNSGFTMIEVLVAVVLIIIGILSVISLAIMVVKGNLQSKRTTIATTIAQEQMEDLIRQGHDAITSCCVPTSTTTVANTTYSWYIDIQGDTPVTNTKTVTVDVWWGSAGSNTVHKNVELQTMITQ